MHDSLEWMERRSQPPKRQAIGSTPVRGAELHRRRSITLSMLLFIDDGHTRKEEQMLYLKPASRDEIEKEWTFQHTIPAEENGFLNDYCGISRKDFDAALDTIIAQSDGKRLPSGWVPQTVYYLWEDDQIVGVFHFRHHLCASLAIGAGHIGYYIAPDWRGKGYASRGLELLLCEIRTIVPEQEIYLRVNKDNPASLSVMLKNGGYIHHEDDTRYYVRIPK